jgi:hypothetical protein
MRAAMEYQFISRTIVECRSSNPLVVEQGMSIAEAKALDKFGHGGGLVDGVLVREHPRRPNSASRDAA